MKAIVIGGGITGCVISSFLADQGFTVHLYESSNQLGGVLNDIYFNENFYYNDCQYLQNNSPWLDELRENININMIEFPHLYGSFTYTNYGQIISKNFAGPIFKYKLSNTEVQIMIKKAQTLSEASSLNERIHCYPAQLSSFFIKWLGNQTQTTLDSLSHFSSIALQFSRIYLKDDEENIINLKSQYLCLDDLLGLPRNYIYKEDSGLTAILPTGGFNDLFKKFQIFLKNKKVNVHLSEFVKCKIKDDKLMLANKENRILEYDLAIWTGSPFPLIRLLMKERISNHLDFCITYVFRFCGSSKKSIDLPFYIQVFSLYHTFRRIYIYPKENNEQIVSVETLQTQTNVNQILSSIYDILEKFDYLGKLEFIGTKKHAKKIFLTRDDLLGISKIKDILQEYDIIDGGWHLYGRESRINYVKDKIKGMMAEKKTFIL